MATPERNEENMDAVKTTNLVERRRGSGYVKRTKIWEYVRDKSMEELEKCLHHVQNMPTSTLIRYRAIDEVEGISGGIMNGCYMGKMEKILLT